MLPERAASFEFYEPSSKEKYSENGYHADEGVQLLKLRQLVSEYLTIMREGLVDENLLPMEDNVILSRGESELVASFSGVLKDDSEQVYNELDKRLREWDMFPLLRLNPNGSEDEKHLIHIALYRPEKPQAWNPLINILLLLATIVSVLFTGASIAIGEIGQQDPVRAQIIMSSLTNMLKEIWRGYPYAIAILAILGTHEMGHYLMSKRHNVAASLPFFIPAFMISPFGTFGAAIALRESMKNRKVLLDIGAAGPIAGFIVAVPILFIGLATSPLTPVVAGGMVEGNSLFYLLAKYLVFGQWLPNAQYDVLLNQVAWAGWTGLFITALNMIPLGQLDGGHVLYSLFGDKARLLYYPLLLLMGVFVLFLSSVWLVFLVMLFFVGRFYAVPLDNITPLDNRRRWFAVLALVIFALCFTPTPLYEQGVSGGLLSAIGIGLLVSVQQYRRFYRA